MKDIIRCQATLMPMELAASSSSRMASKARPSRDPDSRQKQNATTARAIQDTSGPTSLGKESPCAPCVQVWLIRKIRTISANASVAMARNTPRSRISGRPRMNATSIPTPTPNTIATTSDGTTPNSGSAGTTRVEVNAAREAMPSWARLSCPASSTA
jgi:hypothetical protein